MSHKILRSGVWSYPHLHAHVLVPFWGNTACHHKFDPHGWAHCLHGRIMFQKIFGAIIAAIFVILIIMGTMVADVMEGVAG